MSQTTRWMVTLLTALCIPLCCCSLDSLMGGCEGCGAEHAACHESGESDDDAVVHPSPREHCGQEGDAQHGSCPGHKRDRACTCGNDKKIGSQDAKSQISVPSVLFAYIVPEGAALRPFRGNLIGVRPVSRALLRPDQTLLRQHCALIV